MKKNIHITQKKKANTRNLKKLLKRAGFTILITLIFLTGRNLLLPIYGLKQMIDTQNNSTFIEAINAVTGGNFSSLSLFSLGISPWMSTIILWQLIASFESLPVNKLAQKQLYRLQMLVMMVIAVLQGAALLYLQFRPLTEQLPKWQIFSLLLILVTGAVFVVWLGNINGEHGLGGPMFIVIIGMVLNAISVLSTLPWKKILIWHNTPWIILVLILVYFYVWQIVAMSQAEYQIPIRRILIHEEYKQNTTLPIPLLPSSGMQFMYGMVLFGLLGTLFQVLQNVWPKINWIHYIASHLNYQSHEGILFYLGVLTLLCFAFGNLNFNTEEISKGLQKSGDYIPGIMPGAATKKYLDKVLFRISVFEAIYSGLMTGLPLLYSVYYPQFRQYAMSVSMSFILISMSFTIIRQARFIMQYDTTPSIIEYVNKNQ